MNPINPICVIYVEMMEAFVFSDAEPVNTIVALLATKLVIKLVNLKVFTAKNALKYD